MKSLGSIGSFLWALLLVLLAIIGTGNSFKQELWLYNAEDYGIHFDSQVSDTSEYNWFIPQVTRICTTGMWIFFSDASFETYKTAIGLYDESRIFCLNYTTAGEIKSFRYWGANDTDTDALSLYEEKGFWSGKEIYVTEQAVTGITHIIRSIVGTGHSDWTLFEGQNLNGRSRCFQVPVNSNYVFNWNFVLDLYLLTIGSVFKGCDPQEIQNYKALHASQFANTN